MATATPRSPPHLPVWSPPGQIITATADFNVSSTSNFSNAATVVEKASVSFVATDTTTQGTWRNVYGADGYDIAADTSAGNPKLPSYATLGITGASTYTWAGSTTDVRALQNSANTGRIAAAWYSYTSMSFNLNLNDGQSHLVSLYAVDWDNKGRSEEVQIIDPTTGKILDTEAIGHFQGGAYLTWNLSGNVVIKVTNLERIPTRSSAASSSGASRRSPQPPVFWERTRRPRGAGRVSTGPMATTSPPTPAPATRSSPRMPSWGSTGPRPTSGPAARLTSAPCRTPPTPGASPPPGTPARR